MSKVSKFLNGITHQTRRPCDKAGNTEWVSAALLNELLSRAASPGLLGWYVVRLRNKKILIYSENVQTFCVYFYYFLKQLCAASFCNASA